MKHRLTKHPAACIIKHARGCSLVAKLQLPKLAMRVRFPSSAPIIKIRRTDVSPYYFFINESVSRPARCPYGGQVYGANTTTPNSSPRPARRRSGDAQHLGAWGYNPSGSPEGSALWCPPHRRGSRAEPWRCPRRTPPRRGAGVQRAAPSGRVKKLLPFHWTLCYNKSV